MTDLAVLPQMGLLLVRPGMLVAVSPGLGGTHIPPQVKVGLTVLVALGLLPSVSVPTPEHAGALFVMVAREVAIGLSIGLTMRALVAGAELAGHLSGYQMGFSYAATIDPSSGVRNNVISTLFGMLALLAILGVDGHHTLFRTLAQSYASLPIGAGTVSGGIAASLLTSVTGMLALVFGVGIQLAAPIVIVLVLVELAFGLISRSAPSLNVTQVGYPARLALGLFVLGVVVSAVPRVVSGLVDDVTAMAAQTAAAFR